MIIRDQIHGSMEFSELEMKIIDTPEFQRLRRIKQLSFAYLVYPGANHTRFEHSLGTAHLSGTIARRLGLDKETIAKIRLYGLLHDIGHVAFSHEGEEALKDYLGDHEEIGRNKIVKGEIADSISEQYSPKEIAGFEKSDYGAIITSDLGADRMDYLKRDSTNTGVAYGVVDIDRIVHTLLLEKNKNKRELCISHGGLEAAEYLLVARFMMFSAVYLHKTVRIATAMLYKAVEGAIEKGGADPKEFSTFDDQKALEMFAGSKSEQARRYAKAIIERRLYKEICTFSREEFRIGGAKIGALEEKLTEKFGFDILIDYPKEFFKPV